MPNAIPDLEVEVEAPPTGTPILNWTPKKKNFAGLKEALQECELAHPPHFFAIRLGGKWADVLNPGDRIAVSIADSPAQPNVIGHAIVLSTRKGILELLERERVSLNLHIGAKTWKEVVQDMQAVQNTVQTGYKVTKASIVSIVELLAEQDISKRDGRLIKKALSNPQSESPVYVMEEAAGEEEK